MGMDVDVKVIPSMVAVTGDSWERLRCVEFLTYCQVDGEAETEVWGWEQWRGVGAPCPAILVESPV